jgi:hypothetical protein
MKLNINGLINLNFGSPSREPVTWNCIRVRDRQTGLVVQGRITKMQLTDTQKTTVTFGKPVDAKGFPATIEGDPTFSASDDAITLTPVVGDPFSVDVSANHPNVDLNGGLLTISGDADLGDGVITITGIEPYVVIGGQAAGFGPAVVAPPTEQ